MSNVQVPIFEGIPSLTELAEAEREMRPLVLGIPLAATQSFRKCQLNCGFCFAEREKRGVFLSRDEHLDIIDRFAAASGRYVRTATVGEPFLDPLFFDPKGLPAAVDVEHSRFPLIDHANRKGLFWTSFSNLLRVSEEIAEELASRRISMIGKLHAMDPIIQEQMTGNTGRYGERHWLKVGDSRVPAQLKYLMDAGFNSTQGRHTAGTTRLAVDIVATRVNVKSIPAVVRFCLEHNIYPFLEMLELFGTAAEAVDTFQLSIGEREWLWRELCDLLGEDFFSDEQRSRTNCFCPAFTSGMVYNPDGSVRYCYCANAPPLRDVRSGDLLTLFRELTAERKFIRAELESIEASTEDQHIMPPCPMGAFGKPLVALNEIGCAGRVTLAA